MANDLVNDALSLSDGAEVVDFMSSALEPYAQSKNKPLSKYS